jgi:hypothetical protein
MIHTIETDRRRRLADTAFPVRTCPRGGPSKDTCEIAWIPAWRDGRAWGLVVFSGLEEINISD